MLKYIVQIGKQQDFIITDNLYNTCQALVILQAYANRFITPLFL